MDRLKLFSVVQSKVKNRLLLRGMILGGVGVFILFVFGVWAPLAFLSIWGLPIFSLGIFLIGWGLIPYKKFIRLETHPHKIFLEDKQLIFVSNKGGEWIIPYSEIRKITYFESKTKYGLRLETKESRVVFPYFLGDSRLHEVVHANQSNERS